MSFFDNLAQVGGNILHATGIPGLSQVGDAMIGVDNYFLQQGQRQEAMDREDTAVQRRARDLAAAGINPALAAGSAATSTAASMPVQGNIPSGDGAVPEIMKLLKGNLENDNIRAQAELARAHTEEAKSRKEGVDINNAYLRDVNPTRAEGLRLDVAFKNLANPKKLEMLDRQLTGLDYGNINKIADAALKNANIDLAKSNLDLNGLRGKLLQAQEKQSRQSAAESRARTGLVVSQDNLAQGSAAIQKADLQVKLIAVQMAGLNEQFLRELAKTHPGLATGLKNWFSIGTGAVNFVGRAGQFVGGD